MKIVKFLVVFFFLFNRIVVAEDLEISDPIEPVNRGVFWFNDKFDTYLGDPVTEAYDWVMPDFMQTRVRNFFRNIEYPSILVSDLVQLEFGKAASDTGRFLINTTVGVVGVWDAADDIAGMKYRHEDFGLALARQGMGEGPYLVLPILGPSNVRDTVGLTVDFFLNPFYWITQSSAFDSDTDFVIATSAVSLLYLNTKARYLDINQDLKRDSVDYYLGMQSYYTQYRRGQVSKSEAENEDETWFDDELDQE